MSKWIDVDYSKCDIYRQCEIRRPSEKGYYFDIVWVKNTIAKKGTTVIDGSDGEWVIYETYSAKPMEGSRWEFKVKVP